MRVSEVYADRAKSLTAPARTICLDGTSATKKSTILRLTNLPMIKIQRCFPAIEINSHGLSMIGYILAGVNLLNKGQDKKPQVMDRSPLNPFEWYLLWSVFESYLKKFGNVTVRPNEEHREFVEQQIEKFETMRRLPYYVYLRERINTIVIIDSNIDRCDLTRKSRGIGSDNERSDWRFYTFFQNLMYKTLYPDSFIDLNWFSSETEDEVVHQLAMCLAETASDLASRIPCSAPIHNIKLPIFKRSHVMSNAEACTWRAKSKVLIAQRIGSNDDEITDPNNDDQKQVVERMRYMIPEFVQVKDFVDLFGNRIDVTNPDPIRLFNNTPWMEPLTEEYSEKSKTDDHNDYRLSDITDDVFEEDM